MVSDPEALGELNRSAWPFELGLGMIDAREVRLEDPHDLARKIEPLLASYGAERVWIHPSAGLELLPPDRAEEKLRLLKSVKMIINGED